jgi:hypothetical protein
MSVKSRIAVVSLAVAMLAPANLMAQTAADSTAIRQTALDYIDGYYAGNAERMKRALHPNLAKRIVAVGPDGKTAVHNMTATQLVQGTAAGGGQSIPEDRRRSEVTILDIYGNTSSVKIIASDWIDYLHIGKVDDHWVIINVLWELTPEAKERMAAQRRGQ